MTRSKLQPPDDGTGTPSGQGPDRAAIADLVLAYAEAIDRADAASVGTLFTQDAVFRAYDRPQGEARGSDEIHALVAKLVGSFRATVHHVSPTRVVFAGEDHATGVTSLIAWHAFADDRPDGVLWGRYHDRFTREGGTWRFSERVLRIAHHQDFDFPWLPPLGPTADPGPMPHPRRMNIGQKNPPWVVKYHSATRKRLTVP